MVMVGVLLASAFLPWSLGKADVTKRGDKAKKSDVELNIPEAREIAAQFIAGEKVEIELVAATSSLKGVTFLIRQQPQHGFLSEIRPHPKDNHKALVTYQHFDRTAELNDVFSYACRIDGGSFSAPAIVTLTGSKFDPILEVTRQPQFGRIFVGGKATSRVEVKNNGAATYKQALTWESPWSGPPELEVPAGKSVDFLVSFNPIKSGNYRLEMPLQSEVNNSVVALFADAIPALTASPSRLVLNWDSTTKQRSATLTLANSKLDVVEVFLSLPDRLQGPKNLTINPQSKEEIRLFLPASDVAAFKNSLAVTSGEITEMVSVEAAAQPAEIKIVSPENNTIDFRVLNRYEKKQQDFTIENSGGQDLLANILARPPFSVEEAGQVIRLEPGQQRRFIIHVDSRNAGLFETTMDISGASQKLTVRLIADIHEVTDDPAMAGANASQTMPEGNDSAAAKMAANQPDNSQDNKSSSIQPLAQNKSAAAASNTENKQTASEGISSDALKTMGSFIEPRPQTLTQEYLDEEQAKAVLKSAMDDMGLSLLSAKKVNSHLDPVQNIQVKESSSSTLTIVWDEPKIAPAGWRIELAQEVRDPKTGLFSKIWLPVVNVETIDLSSSETRKVGVKITELSPSAQYELRVLGVDEIGDMSMPSPSLLASTLPPWRLSAWTWRILIVTALGLFLFILYRMKRGEYELDF